MYMIEVNDTADDQVYHLWCNIPYLKIDDLVLFESTCRRGTRLPDGTHVAIGRVTYILDSGIGEMPYAICKVILSDYQADADKHRAAIREATEVYEHNVKAQAEQLKKRRDAAMEQLRAQYIEDINSK